MNKKQLKIQSQKIDKELENNNFIENVLRKDLAQWTTTHQNKRNLYKVFGYPSEIKEEEYLAKISRQDIAKRIVESYPNACWGNMPKIEDDVETSESTEFEEQFNILNKKLNLLSYFKNIDILAGWGYYSVLFIGVNDGQAVDTELNLTNLNVDDILFLAPYPQKNAKIFEFDLDPTSRRYGLPKYYNLTTGGYGYESGGSKMMDNQTIKVHHSRVIHVAEGALVNKVIGVPRLEPVYNRLIDLEKIIGGSAETFFLNSRGGLNLNINDPSTVPENLTKLEENMTDFTHNLTRYLRTKGMDVKPLNHDVADPKNHFDVIISLISSTTEIPKRILIGSEQGQLASTQDFNSFQQRVEKRQNNFCESNILRPIIDFFVKHGILPKPKNDYYDITWQSLQTSNQNERSEIAQKYSSAIASYVNANGAELMIPPKQFVEDVLGLQYKEEDLPDIDLEDIEN
jgi:hypothetical protein